MAPYNCAWQLNSVSLVDAYPMPRIDDLIDFIGQEIHQYPRPNQGVLAGPRGWRQPFNSLWTCSSFDECPWSPRTCSSFDECPWSPRSPGHFPEDDGPSYGGRERIHGSLFGQLGHMQSYLGGASGTPRGSFTRLQEAGLTGKPRKCQFEMAQCVYLGHIVGAGQVQVEMSKVEVIREMPVTWTKKEVCVLLGLTSYHLKFISNHASTLPC